MASRETSAVKFLWRCDSDSLFSKRWSTDVFWTNVPHCYYKCDYLYSTIIDHWQCFLMSWFFLDIFMFYCFWLVFTEYSRIFMVFHLLKFIIVKMRCFCLNIRTDGFEVNWPSYAIISDGHQPLPCNAMFAMYRFINRFRSMIIYNNRSKVCDVNPPPP